MMSMIRSSSSSILRRTSSIPSRVVNVRAGFRHHRRYPAKLSRCCNFSSSSTTTVVDQQQQQQRVSGRQRFYRTVNVQAARAPWEEDSNKASSDGEDSVSSTAHRRRSVLTPRRPFPIKSNDTATAANTSAPLNWFTVTLDGLPLKTPAGHALVVPSELLAFGLAAEWDSQQRNNVIINPTQMPLMTLVCTTLDQTVCDENMNMQHYQEFVLKFVPTDAIGYWADPTTAVNRGLYRMQNEAWTPILQTCQEAFGGGTDDDDDDYYYAPATTLTDDALTTKLPHPPQLLQAVQKFVDALDAWHLTILYSVVTESKSFFVGSAMLYDDDASLLSTCIQAARVEEEYQIANWGLVEGGHDYDRLNCAVQLRAAALVQECLAQVC